ncbi:MAG: Fe-S cluster protein [Candidatus Kerfeldbacteria bacterium CG15_BIG_FIL_POST_REV_8_21_14_020_45_12]|uniref:Fe-S cluster protein n=1 Tax=Candidatus Kerfeldbacteria bacterium CG15_BIG_FIL_POST_REV_8_21_14_020_45_12 TaxID=2014247 RepID=A0A2M7H3Y0_9BACT|nr:MAG: Fe-S cluster protein [Candidatus Kerfeldbacteria bacterium CG15_BIG_FIL_POST_REV_8_21_14_020_45_12]PJA92764.1 MAG: Fe-S cluster protein [Candidatus Kerfeldbacteria bacterium CG_4_9_14_3_um_filter_45_8]
MDIYQEEILDHYRHPRNSGSVENPDIIQTERNSSCGDELIFSFKLADGKVAEVMFTGEGCAISQAAASMLTEDITGQAITKAKQLTPDDVIDLLGIELGPTRLKCALLPVQAITKALADK